MSKEKREKAKKDHEEKQQKLYKEEQKNVKDGIKDIGKFITDNPGMSEPMMTPMQEELKRLENRETELEKIIKDEV